MGAKGFNHIIFMVLDIDFSSILQETHSPLSTHVFYKHVFKSVLKKGYVKTVYGWHLGGFRVGHALILSIYQKNIRTMK